VNDTKAKKNSKRDIRDGPFCWFSKQAMRMIAENFAESKQVASARCVYVALCELASDAAAATFTETEALIAHKAGVSVKTVERVLPGLVELGVLRIETATVSNQVHLKAPSRYTLLSIRLGDASMRLGEGLTKSDKVEQVEQKNKKEEEGAFARKARTRTLSRSFSPKVPYPETEEEMFQVLDSLGIEPVPDYDGNFFNQMQRSGWRVRGQRVVNWPELYRGRLEVTQPQ
jgi:hypothetical protein